MTDLISCPSCGYPIDPYAIYCSNCKTNLAIAAALAEQKLIPTSTALPVSFIAPEILVPRLGEYLQDKGVLTADELQRALEFQKNAAVNGRPNLLGHALVELGLTTRETIDQATTEQIYLLQSALEQANRLLVQRIHERTAELQDAVNRLTELSQLKSNFISNISHELRTPLTHIIGYIGLLLDGSLGSLDEEQIQALDVVLKAGERLEKLFDDLIQYSAAVRGELSLNMQLIDIVSLIHDIIDRQMPRVKDKHQDLEVDINVNAVHVHGDPEKLDWMFGELINNAIKYTPTGGKISISARKMNGLVSFIIEDTGIGFPEEKIDELFLPFHQLDGSTTRRFGGTGLGLALVKQIIEGHGSHIKVRSNLGQGTRFEFSLIMGYQ